ncbi:MAG: SusC/RagA family TonB-linked outer membrane protein [Tannerellaceae bacterium]|nr:SusC/RagA family TonB-linked outer membrane protein [Tannerellaceae bacterium]
MKNKTVIGVNLPYMELHKMNRIIRLTILLLTFCIICSYAGEATIQNVRISIDKTNVVLEEVLSDIEAQTDYLFVYNNEVEVNQKVSVHASNKLVNNLLNEILKNSGIAYRMEGNHIILYKVNTPAPTQQKDKINGRIVDESGEPVIGANVYEKNTIKGTITDIDGNFSLEVAPNTILVVSYIGYISMEVNVGSNKNIEIILQEDTQRLEEVVVVGYGTQKKANLTGAVSTVSSEVLEDRPLTSVGAGLQGVIPGLYVSFSNGAPGSEAKFNIRGVSNLEGQASALVLIDGVEMDPTILNPNDIKEVTVLKDAASAAIYGSRAAYGVILITTKTGFINRKPQVTFTANYAINTPTVKPKGMNSLEYTQWMNDANMTTNGSPYFDEETMQHVRAYYNDPVNNLPVFNHSQDAASTWRYAGNTDWYKELNKSSYPMQQYNVSVVGGSENATYYASAGYFNQKGISRWADENYDRYNVMQNVRYKVSNMIQVGLQTTLSISDRTTGGQNKHGGMALANIVAQDSRPLMPLYHPDGNFSGNSGDGSFTNPVAWQSLGGSANYRMHDIMARGYVKPTPIAGLSIDMDYTYRYFNWGFKNYRREYYDYDAAGVGALFPHTTPNAVSYDKSEDQNNILNIFATYEKKINEIHAFKIMVGFNQESYILKEVGLSRTNLMSNDIPFLELATGDRTTTDAQEEWTTRGTFFRLNYDLKDRYLFAVLGRYDASSRYPKNQRFAYFPSFSAAWKISDENFWKPVKYYVNTFKLRASYGSLGDQGVYGSYPTISSYGTGQINYLFNGVKEMRVEAPSLVSPQLTWEKVTDWNVGVDFGLLDNRLTGTVEIFQKDIKDLMTKSQKLPGVLGASEPRTNAANLRYRGGVGITIKLEASVKKRFQLSVYGSCIRTDWMGNQI